MKTLRDYMKEHHPEYISTATSGGVYVCPTTVPDFNHLNLEPLCDGYTFPIYHDICCTACWDQPYTPPNNIEETHSPEPAKTYEDGLNEAWKLQQKLSGLTYQQLENAGMSQLWRECSYQEAKSRYDKFATIKPGDEVEYIDDNPEDNIFKGDTGYILSYDNYGSYFVLAKNRKPRCQSWFFSGFHKTGKHNSKLAEAISEITEDPQ